ncbi:MAG: Gfo/Idh/MocA family protein [Candidatus Eiseniibacteriota bacterium]
MKKRPNVRRKATRTSARRKRVRYAVVGLGHIAQNAILPAFKHAARNSELAALVSSDPTKLEKLGRKYGIRSLYSYEQFGDCLESGNIDAVYIALPNHLHHPYTIAAAEAGIHVLCEKPLAVTGEECEQMIEAAERSDVRLMTAYRLHFEPANMRAVEIVRAGRLGEPRMFSSVFTMQVKAGDIRLDREKGGGTLYDIGIYCINAARYLFRAEPIEVEAMTASGSEKRFAEVEEMTACLLRFPDERFATFQVSFGAADVSSYRIVGTKGDLVVDAAYEYGEERQHVLTVGGRTSRKRFPCSDQFAPELLHFSDCVLRERQPVPSGAEGLADVRIIEALYRAAGTGRPEPLRHEAPTRRPTSRNVIERPPVHEPMLVHSEPPQSRD